MPPDLSTVSEGDYTAEEQREHSVSSGVLVDRRNVFGEQFGLQGSVGKQVLQWLERICHTLLQLEQHMEVIVSLAEYDEEGDSDEEGSESSLPDR